MDFVKVTEDQRVVHIYLGRGRSNALDQQMLEELRQAIVGAGNNPAIEGMILHGQTDFFSAGLDLVALYEYNEAEVRRFWQTFFDFVLTLVSFEKPAVAAISGHSPAGGCVIAICCDYRIMAQGNYVIGLNEIPVGMPVPEPIFLLYSFWLGKARAYRYLLEGKLLNPDEALEVGLVDEVVDVESIRTAAERQIARYTQYEQNAWRESKRRIRQSLIAQFEADQTEVIESLLKRWWSPATRTILKAIIDNLKSNK